MRLYFGIALYQLNIVLILYLWTLCFFIIIWENLFYVSVYGGVSVYFVGKHIMRPEYVDVTLA